MARIVPQSRPNHGPVKAQPCWVGFWAACVLLVCADARADAADVWLGIDATLASDAGFVDAMDMLLEQSDVRVRRRVLDDSERDPLAVLAASDVTPNMGVVWVLRDERGLSVATVDASAENMLLRRLPGADPTSFASQEEVAIIVRASLQGLAAGHALGFQQPAPEPVATPAPSPPSPPVAEPPAVGGAEAWLGELALSLAYTTSSYASQLGFQHGVRVGLGGWELAQTGLYGELGLSLLRADQIVSQGAAVELTRTPAEIVAGHRLRWGRLGFASELAVLLDLTRSRSRATAANVRVEGSALDVGVAFSPRLWLLLRAGERTWLRVGAGAELVVRGVDYTVRVLDASGGEEQQVVVVAPRRLRPVLLAGLVVAL